MLRTLVATVTLTLAACSTVPDPLARPGEPTTQDFLGLANRQAADVAPPRTEPPIPDLQPMLVAPPPALADSRLVSLTVTEDVPLRDVLIELAREANVNLEMDPDIQGGIVFIARDQPLIEVLERISSLAGLRYRFENNFLRVERDRPYTETYRVDFLAMNRAATSSVDTSSNILAAVDGGGAAGNNGSDSRIVSQSASDLWPAIQANLGEILASTAPAVGTGTTAQPLSVNPQAGIVSVFGTSRQQRAVASYLERVRQAVSAQVLIEARIVEVSLDERYQAGIEWSTLFGGAFNVGVINPLATDIPAFAAVIESGDLSAVATLLRNFGTTRTLSSPRVTVLNNQTSVLKVAENEIYFTFSVTPPTYDENGRQTSPAYITSTPRSVPIGVVMTVQPAIDSAANEIMLNLRPTVTRVARRIEDPAVRIVAAQAGVTGITSEIPVVEVRELDSVVRMRSGETVVLGGLMQERATGDSAGVPGAMDVPVLGNLFKSRNSRSNVVELVILLRATIAEGARTLTPADLDLYRNFTNDPRPLTF